MLRSQLFLGVVVGLVSVASYFIIGVFVSSDTDPHSPLPTDPRKTFIYLSLFRGFIADWCRIGQSPSDFSQHGPSSPDIRVPESDWSYIDTATRDLSEVDTAARDWSEIDTATRDWPDIDTVTRDWSDIDTATRDWSEVDSAARGWSPDMSRLVALDFEVFGRVQGVFFRKCTLKEAQRLRLVGWCRNTAEGSVAGHVQGPRADVTQMRHWLQHVGSPSSKIDRAEFSSERMLDTIEFQQFVIKK